MILRNECSMSLEHKKQNIFRTIFLKDETCISRMQVLAF